MESPSPFQVLLAGVTGGRFSISGRSCPSIDIIINESAESLNMDLAISAQSVGWARDDAPRPLPAAMPGLKRSSICHGDCGQDEGPGPSHLTERIPRPHVTLSLNPNR